MTDWAGQQNLTDTILPAQSVIFNLSYRCQNTQISWFHFSFVYIDVVFSLFVVKIRKYLRRVSWDQSFREDEINLGTDCFDRHLLLAIPAGQKSLHLFVKEISPNLRKNWHA